MCTGVFDRCTAFAGRCKRQAAASCGAGTNCVWSMCMCILVSARVGFREHLLTRGSLGFNVYGLLERDVVHVLH